MLMRKWFVPLFGFMVPGIVTGCSGSKGSYATVSGVVTQNGAPFDGAKVTFISTVESEGKRATYSAMTDSNGKYLIATVGKEPGIPPGMYKVTVTKLEATGRNLPKDFDAGQVAASGTGRNLVSQEYENENTTKLSVTLEPGKNENQNFDVKPATGSRKSPGEIPIP
jgi:hypothetical protein